MPITSPDYDFLPDDTHHALAAIGYRHRPVISGADPAMEPQREEMSRRIQQLFTERGDGRGAMALDDSHRLAVVVGQSAGLLDAYENFPGHGDVIPYREDHVHLMELARRLFRDWGQGGRAGRAEQPAAPAPAQPEGDATPPAAEPQPQPARVQEPFVPISIPQIKLTRPSFRRIKKGRQIIGAAGKHGLKLFGISTEETPPPKPKEEAPAPAKPEPEKKEKKEEAEEKPKRKAA